MISTCMRSPSSNATNSMRDWIRLAFPVLKGLNAGRDYHLHHLCVVSIGTSNYFQNDMKSGKPQSVLGTLRRYSPLTFPMLFFVDMPIPNTVDEHPYFLMFTMFLMFFRNSINMKVNIPLIPVSIFHRKIRKQTFII